VQLEWTPRAREERGAAIEYIAQENPTAALDQLDKIEQQIDMLLQHPEMGRPGRKQGTRDLVIVRTNFIVVYRFKPKAKYIVILRVLHALQDYTK
jgi:toxin ParE1/3/4